MHRRKATPVARRIVPVAVAASALRLDPYNLGDNTGARPSG
jgi:hypothetical protein